MSVEFKPIVTERLTLRRFRLEDGETFWRYRTDEEVAKYQGLVSRFTQSMAAKFAREQSTQKPGVPGTWFQLAIELSTIGEMIGDCGIHTLSESAEQVELGITIAREHQGKGYAREALIAVLNYLFGVQGKARIIALTDPRNSACIRLLESLGMKRKAYLEKHVQVRGEWMDDVLYTLSAEQWQASAVKGAQHK